MTEAEDPSRSGVRRAVRRQPATAYDAALGLVDDLVSALRGAHFDERALLDGAAVALNGDRIAYRIEIHESQGVTRYGPCDPRVDAAVAPHARRAMAERHAVWGAGPGLAALSLDWLLCVPIDDDERTLGVLLVYPVGRDATPPSESLMTTLVEIIAAALAGRRREAALGAELGQRDRAMETIAHDLKNPLGVVTMGTSLLRPIIMDSEAAVLVDAIDRNGRYAVSLVEDILEAAVMSGAVIVLRREPCNVPALIDDVISALGPRALAKRLRIERCTGPAPEHAFIDPRRATQVLFNLIGNAVKFTPPGGSIRVAVRRLEGATVFSIRDSGPGIGREQLTHIFERFWRGETSESGTGLGLTIARGIVEAHGGVIWVESELGRGTNVAFTMPDVPNAERDAS